MLREVAKKLPNGARLVIDKEFRDPSIPNWFIGGATVYFNGWHYNEKHLLVVQFPTEVGGGNGVYIQLKYLEPYSPKPFKVMDMKLCLEVK